MVKEKFSNELRFIYDLSTPRCSHIPSLNSLIPSEVFSLKYAFVDQAIQQIIRVGEGACLSKADIADASDYAVTLAVAEGEGGCIILPPSSPLDLKAAPCCLIPFAQALSRILTHVEYCDLASRTI